MQLARWADGLCGKSAGRLGGRQAGRQAGRLGGGGWPRYPIVGVNSPSPLSPVTESPVTVISRYRYLPPSPVTVISRYRYRPVIFCPLSPVTVISPLPLSPVIFQPVISPVPLSPLPLSPVTVIAATVIPRYPFHPGPRLLQR